VKALAKKFPNEDFNFLPETFVIPDEYNDFVQAFQKR
jgi:hypothetical protein